MPMTRVNDITKLEVWSAFGLSEFYIQSVVPGFTRILLLNRAIIPLVVYRLS